LADPQRAESQAGCIGAIENVIQWHVWVFAACVVDQRAPPAASGEQRRRGGGDQCHRTSHGESGPRVGQTMHDDRRIPITDHWLPIIDICLTFKRLPAFSSTCIERQGTAMASDVDDPEAEADRLEAALNRIAQAAARGAMASAHTPAAPGTEEIAARIDGLIDRLRTALGSVAD
jgi:hypothetical protein